jgi:2-dehydropantoate 2-reductase
MRILIVGAGALGGYFGARLLNVGRDVTFLVRPQRARQLIAHGLQLISPKANLSFDKPPIVQAKDLREPYDLILLSCKAYDLVSSMDSFAPAVGPGTAILPMLNGMAHMATLDARFGRDHVLGGLSNISAVRLPDGRIEQLGEWDRLHFGDRDEPSGPRAKLIESTLANAGFESALRPNIEQEMWDKWVTIATAAGITCLMRARIGDIVAAGGVPLVLQLMQECVSIAAREGFPLQQPTLDRIAKMFTSPGSTFTASMLRDLESGAPIEAHQILGDLLDHAHRDGLATPLLNIAHVHVRCYEERRKREMDPET